MVSCKNKSSSREKVMMWLSAYSTKGFTSLVILNEGTVDHSCYIKNVLFVALKYRNEVFGDTWIFQLGDTNSHRQHLTQEWCRNNFPSLIDKRIVGLQTVQI